MAKISHKIVEVRINECHTVRRCVPLWELPLLQAMHGVESVTEVGEEDIERKVPDAEQEFTRLGSRYKNMKNEDGSKGSLFVVGVYGQFGVKALKGAIDSSIVQDAPVVAVAASAIV